MKNTAVNRIFKYKNLALIFVLVTTILLSNSLVFSASKSVSTKEASKTTPQVFSTKSITTASDESPQSAIDNPVDNYQLNISTQNAIVVELGRGMVLYSKKPDEKISIPAASKIMTAIIALETIPLDAKITISKVASSQSDANAIALNNGEKYSLEYLLYGMILRDNNAAAIAISEQISGVEIEFVKLMNTKAIAYQMTNTKFVNSTGVFDEKQFSTIKDISRLVRFAMTSSDFKKIITTKDIPFFLSTNKAKHLINGLSRVWDFVDYTNGALISSSENQNSFVQTSSYGGINFFIIGVNKNKNKIIDDITAISQAIYSDYESSSLVLENQIFPKTIKIGSDAINLVFKQTVSYVHPKGNDYVSKTIYEENPIIQYPVQMTKSIAKVTFELLDGTKITADLYPDKTVWGESSIYLKLLGLYDSNRDIGTIIILSFGLLVILLIINTIKLLKRFFRNILKSSKNHNIKE